MALELDWGADDKVVSVTASDFMKDRWYIRYYVQNDMSTRYTHGIMG